MGMKRLKRRTRLEPRPPSFRPDYKEIRLKRPDLGKKG
jgi:hypothetical protein